MRKRFCLFFALIATFLLCGALSACGDKSDETTKTIVTYYLNSDAEPMTATVFDGTFSFNTVPKKDHCTFLGLFDDKTGGTKIVDEFGRCNIVIQSNITLWAHWKSNNCDIVFDAGKGTLPSASRSMSLIYGSMAPDFPVPELEGYTFVGWTSKGALVSEGATPINSIFDSKTYIFEPNSDTVLLEAKYEVKQFTLTLDYNDSSYRAETRIVNYGDTLEAVDLPREDTGSSEMIGWSTERNRNVPFTGTFGSDITLYAVWRDYKVFKFYTDSETYTENRVYRDMEYEIPDAEKTGYRLDGWYPSQTFSGNPVVSVSYGSSVTSYYAKWEAIEYHITFDVDGGDAVLGISYTIEQEVVLPDAGKKQFCVFVGWCKNQDRSDTPLFTLPQGTYGDLTLYAKWKGEDRTVILDPNNGVVQNERYTVEYGTSLRLPVPVRDGYDFLGWYTGDGIKMTDERGNGSEKFEIVEQEITLYANWQIKTYTVEYHTNGGSAVSPQKYEHGALLQFPDQPTKPDMEFEGWYLNSACSLRAEEGTPVLRNMTLYAKWHQMTEISSANDLKAVAQNPDRNYRLTKDINLDGEIWTPIENFSGIFDGNDHRIYNFTISSTSTVPYLGFFAVNSGVIKNLTLDGVVYNYTADSATSAGVFAGKNDGEILHCTLNRSSLTLHGNYYNVDSQTFLFGGLVGQNENTVVGCKIDETSIVGYHDSSTSGNSGNYVNYLYLGGLIGSDKGQVTECYSKATITVTQSASNQWHSTLYASKSFPASCVSAGGIVGDQDPTGVLQQCLSEAALTINLGTCYGDQFGTRSYIGGLVGSAGGKVDTCKAVSALDVATVNLEGCVGGLIGTANGDINNSYASSTIQVDRSMAGQTAGGCVGVNSGVVRNCYSAGTILSQKGTTGGFCGNNQGTGTINRCISLTKLECNGEKVGKFNGNNTGTISNCYYADNVSIDGDYCAEIATEMAADRILRYDFLCDELYWNTTYWLIDENGETLPKLKWESE